MKRAGHASLVPPKNLREDKWRGQGGLWLTLDPVPVQKEQVVDVGEKGFHVAALRWLCEQKSFNSPGKYHPYL